MSTNSAGGSRVAFFGGSFDPPHLGHIAVAEAAQRELSLDRVLFAPVGLQPLKPAGSAASFEDRVAMTRLAIAGHVGFEISLLDAPGSGAQSRNSKGLDGGKRGRAKPKKPNYTFDTLTALRQSLGPEAELFLLLGADSFRTLHNWHRAAELVFLAHLIVASRPTPDPAPECLTDVPACMPRGVAVEAIPGQPHRYSLSNGAGDRSLLIVLPHLDYDISATQLRNLVQDTSSLSTRNGALLNPAVLDYIRDHGLYPAESART